MYLNCKYSGKKIFFHSCVYVFELKMTSVIFLWVSKSNQALQFCLVNGKHLEIDEPLPNFVWVWILRPCSSVSLIQFCNGKVSIQSFFFFWDVWRMSPKSRKSDKNFWTYLCSTSKSNFRFAIGSDRILTSFWFRAYKSNIDLVMENTLFIIGNLADMCSGKVVWKYETIFDTHLMWQVATCMYLNSLHQNLDK